MKTPEELNALKEELEALNRKLAELSKEELEQVAGGCPGAFGSPILTPPWERRSAELSEEELKQVSGGVYQGACFIYVIEKGDTVSGIAERFGTDVKILCELNNIHRLSEQLYPGNKLLVPCN